jgi:glycosyltransferase involved in cell wall biosynthesis
VNVAIVIATCGDEEWADLAWSRAYPSARGQAGILDAAQVVIEHYPRLDVAQARNAAARHSDRDWLCFLDADDELEADYLYHMDLARGWMGQNDDEPPPEDWDPAPLLVPAVRYVQHTAGELMRRMIARAPAAIPNQGRWPEVSECVVGTLVKADLFWRLGGFRSRTWDGTPLSIYEDYDLFLRAHDHGSRLVHVPQAVYRAHVRRGGRNAGPDAKGVYDAIWREHVVRTGATAR